MRSLRKAVFEYIKKKDRERSTTFTHDHYDHYSSEDILKVVGENTVCN